MNASKDSAVDAVRTALKAAGLDIEVKTKKALPTAVAAKAKALKCEPGAIVRAEMYLIGDAPVLALLSGGRGCRHDQLPRIFFLKGDVAKAKADRVRAVTGFSMGGLGPCGHKEKMPVAIDVALKGHDSLVATAGDPDAYFTLSAEDLKRLTGGIVSYALARDP